MQIILLEAFEVGQVKYCILDIQKTTEYLLLYSLPFGQTFLAKK